VNRVFRLVWSRRAGIWVAVAETCRARGKGARAGRLVHAALGVLPLLALAGPQGGQVVSGAAQIAQQGAQTTITQMSPQASLQWSSFNIGVGESVRFVQPSASAIAVNRIRDTQGSQILGQLSANGQVWLINPNGILFGRDAQVNVGGLVASTLELDDRSLASSTRRFLGGGAGRIVNLGRIEAAPGGYVALLGHQVVNQGVISAKANRHGLQCSRPPVGRVS
jgi:filamentous hemagglutinin family protein